MSEHAEIAAALVAALADLTVVEKGRTANAGSYSYEYADIADVVKLTRGKLAEHGLVALTPVHDHGSELACTVTLLHTSGERLDFGPFPFPKGRDAQATGSMVTYHRRYALVAALGMAAGDDDDGATAHAAPPRQEPAVSGVSVADAGAKLRDHIAPHVEGDPTDHAKAVWKQAQPKKAGDVVPDAEVARLLAAADEYLADLREMAKDEQMQAALDAIVHEAEMDKAGDR